MGTEVWEDVSANGHATDNRDSVMAASSAANSHTHEPCEVRQVFFPAYHERNMFQGPQTTGIAELRLGFAAACQGCELVLDAVTTHIYERLQEDQIAAVYFWKQNWKLGSYQIVLEFHHHLDDTKGPSPPKPDITLELFQPKGKLLSHRSIQSRQSTVFLCSLKEASLQTSKHITVQNRWLVWLRTCITFF